MKGCSPSLVVREMHIKTSVRYYYIPTKMTKVKKTNNAKCWLGCGAIGTFICCWWESKLQISMAGSYIVKHKFAV